MIDGILYSAQFLHLSYGLTSVAQDLMTESGYSMDKFLKEQKESGYETRKMNKIIKETFNNQPEGD